MIQNQLKIRFCALQRAAEPLNQIKPTKSEFYVFVTQVLQGEKTNVSLWFELFGASAMHWDLLDLNY